MTNDYIQTSHSNSTPPKMKNLCPLTPLPAKKEIFCKMILCRNAILKLPSKHRVFMISQPRNHQKKFPEFSVTAEA